MIITEYTLYAAPDATEYALVVAGTTFLAQVASGSV